ncbi:MAG: GYD domain-containing protein [Xanthobacteraceae bacterium]
MHFCFAAQYTPQALNGMMDNPTANRFEAAKKVIEAAGGKLISMYGMPANGPGVMVIFEAPDQTAASAVSTVVVASGGLQDVKLVRLIAQEELVQIRQKASQLRGAYKPPGK